MADRQLSNALSSGELTNIQLGGTGTPEKVLTQAEIDAKILVLENGKVKDNTDAITNVANSINFDIQLGVNVDTLTSVGLYEIDNSTPTSLPTGVSSSLELKVIGFTTSNKIVQELLDLLDGKKYTRIALDFNAPVWTAWSEDAQSANDSYGIVFRDKVPIAYAEGNMYYQNGVMNIRGKYSDVTLQMGRETHMEVINNTGSTILNGSAVKHNGVSGGDVQVVLAIATTFQNAIILGIATHDIPSGTKGIITVFGEVGDIDTNGLTVGAPIYLSDTIAGGFTSSPPDVATQIGGVLTADATIGKIFVSIENTINLPSTQGYLQGQTSGTYNIIAGVPTTVINYAKEGNLIMGTSIAAGTISPNTTGVFNMNFTFSGTTDTEKQSLEIELFDSDLGVVLYTHVLPTGRDLDGGKIATSFSVPGNILNDTAVLSVRIKPDANMVIVINQCSFSLNSLHIR